MNIATAAAQLSPIRNRIKAFRVCKPVDFIPHPMNPRVHPEEQRDAVLESLLKYGITKPVIAQEFEGKLRTIDGHLRIELFPPDTEIPTCILEDGLSEDVIKEILLLLDPTGLMATYDPYLTEALRADADFDEEGILMRLAESLVAEEDRLALAEQMDDENEAVGEIGFDSSRVIRGDMFGQDNQDTFDNDSTYKPRDAVDMREKERAPEVTFPRDDSAAPSGPSAPSAEADEEYAEDDGPIATAEDAIFPSRNDLDIPELLPAYQATSLVLPAVVWGDVARTTRMPGTWMFYTDDYKFNALWKSPENLVNNTRPAQVIEVNYSMGKNTPTAWVHGLLYKKRWLSRYWQSQGIKIIVDLFVAERFFETNLLGVPKGWKAYSTRGHSNDLDRMDDYFERACGHAGTKDILFLIYGGGKKVAEHCKERLWNHIPDKMQQVAGRATRMDMKGERTE